MRVTVLLLALMVAVSGIGATPAHADTVVAKDARSLAAALDKAQADKRIRRIELATGTYEVGSPVVIDETLSGTPELRSC